MYSPSDTEAQHEDSSSMSVYRFSSPKKPSEYIPSASDMLRYLGPRLSASPPPPLQDGPASVERHHAPSLHRRATDLETKGHHPYRSLQSEIIPISRYGYSSHNPTDTMANVETSPPQRTTKTRRREAWQIDILEAFYRHKHMPDKQEKEMLANRISDTLKYVNIWFQNRRQAAQKKGELRPRETYEHWRHRRHADYDLYSGPTPPEYSTSAASTSYFAQSYPTHETMLATPREMEEHRMPSVSSSMMASPPGGQPAHSPFAFALPLPLKGHSGANPLPIPESRSRPVYASATSYERPTCTPPHSAEGLPATTHAYNHSQSYPDYPRPDVTRSISMRREAPGPSISEFHLAKGPPSLLLPSLPGLGLSNSGSIPNASPLIPRRESGTGEEYPFPSRPAAMSPPSDLKLPPISSLALLDEDTWISAIAARRSQ